MTPILMVELGLDMTSHPMSVLLAMRESHLFTGDSFSRLMPVHILAPIIDAVVGNGGGCRGMLRMVCKDFRDAHDLCSHQFISRMVASLKIRLEDSPLSRCLHTMVPLEKKEMLQIVSRRGRILTHAERGWDFDSALVKIDWAGRRPACEAWMLQIAKARLHQQKLSQRYEADMARTLERRLLDQRLQDMRDRHAKERMDRERLAKREKAARIAERHAVDAVRWAPRRAEALGSLVYNGSQTKALNFRRQALAGYIKK